MRLDSLLLLHCIRVSKGSQATEHIKKFIHNGVDFCNANSVHPLNEL